MEDANGFLIPLVVFSSISFIFFIIVITRHKEKMAMIEKGFDPKTFETAPKTNYILRTGLLFAGVGLGIMLGGLIETLTDIEGPTAYFSMILLFSGLSQVIAFVVDKKQTAKN